MPLYNCRMKLFTSHNNALQESQTAIVATIGFFDGVHAGHRFLIEQVKGVAQERGLPSAVITFPQHPRAVLHQDFQPKLLNSREEREELLRQTGVDYCFVLDFTPEMSELSANIFIGEVLVGKYRVDTLVVGYDHRFGKNRAEGFEDYKKSGEKYGMNVVLAKELDEKLHVSSTVIRNALLDGKVSLATQLLGYYYSLTGRVVEGNQLGRTIGFPTANIQLLQNFKVIPKEGIYAVLAFVNTDWYQGMAYIGTRPSITTAGEMRFEVNLFEFSGNLYEQPIEIAFVAYLREDMKFENLEDLKLQLEEDKRQALYKLRI